MNAKQCDLGNHRGGLIQAHNGECATCWAVRKAVAQAVAEKDEEIARLETLVLGLRQTVTDAWAHEARAVQQERNEGQVRLANAVARAVEGERTRIADEYYDALRNGLDGGAAFSAALRAPAKP
jgi:hypothetical protein